MLNQEIAKKIAEIIAPKSGVFGLRKTYDLSVGDDVPNSYDWDYENDRPSDVELDGASVIGLPDIYDEAEIDDVLIVVNEMAQYPGNKLVLIAGDYAGLGADKNELLIANGVVLMSWDSK